MLIKTNPIAYVFILFDGASETLCVIKPINCQSWVILGKTLSVLANNVQNHCFSWDLDEHKIHSPTPKTSREKR